MPLHYRNKKRGKKGRRRGRGRRGKKFVKASGLANRVANIMNKKHQQVRVLKILQRTVGIESPINKAVIIPIIVCGALANLHDFMDMAVEDMEDKLLSGVVLAGTYRSPVDGSLINRPTGAELMANADGSPSEKDGYKCRISNYRTNATFKNVDIHPVNVTIYEVLCKSDRTNNSAQTGVKQQIQSDLFNGLVNSQHAAGTSTVTKIFGDDLYESVDFAAGFDTHVTSWDVDVSPKQSGVFNQYWKMVKQKSFRLMPGDEVKWRSPPINYNYSPKKLLNADTAEDTESIKNITRVLLIKFYGPIGRGELVGGESEIGHMTSELAITSSCTAKILPYWSTFHGAIRATTLDKDDETTFSMTGVTEFEQKDDDPLPPV